MDFSNDDQSKARSYIKSIIEIALSDGWVNDQEISFLTEVAKRFNLSPQDFKDIKKQYKKEGFVMPSSPHERFQLFYDLVKMMMIDGSIDENERILCNNYARNMGYDQDMVDRVIDLINQDISRVRTFENANIRTEKLRKAC